MSISLIRYYSYKEVFRFTIYFITCGNNAVYSIVKAVTTQKYSP